MNQFCCDKHDNGFDLADFFPGRFQTAETFEFVDQAVNAASSRPKYRPKKERKPLKTTFYSWRARAHQNDLLRGVQQVSWILSDTDIEAICKAPQKSLTNVDQLKTLLANWVDEWGHKIVDEVCSFNVSMLPSAAQSTSPSTSQQQPATDASLPVSPAVHTTATVTTPQPKA
jgi:hypothetical protein